jgi:glycosyltransferase involved in cell wall biosynthesis
MAPAGRLIDKMSSDREPLPSVSVIVPCYNSERTIRQCLDAILRQQTSFVFDITVVDSSADGTANIVAREYPTVRLIRSPERLYAGAARNVGVRATRAPLCLMIDSDCVAAPDLIDRAVERHREGHYAAVGGALRNGTPESLSGLIGYLIEFKEFMPTTPLRLETSIPTANLAYRRETILRYGGFDDDLWMAEDILLNWKMHRAGEQILFDPDIQVTHLNRTGWRTVLAYQIGLGRMSAEARRRGALPGGFLLRHRWLIPLLPFARTLKAVRWFAAHDKKLMLAFLFIWPLYWLAAAFWAYGFLLSAYAKGERKSGPAVTDPSPGQP